MELKPILFIVFPEFLGLNSKQLTFLQNSLREEFKEYFVLVMITPEAEEVYMELATWKSMSYLSYATFLQIIDPSKYEKLERWRQMEIMGCWTEDLGEDED